MEPHHRLVAWPGPARPSVVAPRALFDIDGGAYILHPDSLLQKQSPGLACWHPWGWWGGAPRRHFLRAAGGLGLSDLVMGGLWPPGE